MAQKHCEIHWKSIESTDRSIKKLLQEWLHMANVCHCPRGLLWRKCCINRCNVTYFYLINQF
jgi:hypothetical protein